MDVRVNIWGLFSSFLAFPTEVKGDCQGRRVLNNNANEKTRGNILPISTTTFLSLVHVQLPKLLF